MVRKPPSSRRRTKPLLGASALLSAALLVGGCASDREGAVDGARQAIAGGTVDLTTSHVFLLLSHSQGSGGLCTATLIAPNLLLTARHCVSPGDGEDRVRCGDSMLGEPFPPNAFLALNDPHPSEASPSFRASEVRVPGEGVDTCGYDIALVVLSENVPASISTPAVPRIDRDVVPGEKYTAVGYGVNENGDPNGSRMKLSGLTIACQPGSCGEGVESTEFRGETGICSGDSGGPALDADGKVVGVVSRGGPDCSYPVYGTVTAWKDFLIDTATHAAEVGNYEPPFWVTTRSSDPPSEGGAGGAGAEAPRGEEGDACRSSGECADGLVCFGSGSGVCRATCQSTAECGAGEVCEDVGGVSLCAAPSHSGDDAGGCSVAAPRGVAGGAWVLLGLLLTALRRRQR